MPTKFPCWRYVAPEWAHATRGADIFRQIQRQPAYMPGAEGLGLDPNESAPEVVITTGDEFPIHPCASEILFAVMVPFQYDAGRYVKAYSLRAHGVIIDITADLWNLLKTRPEPMTKLELSKMSPTWQWWLKESRPKHLMRALTDVADVITCAMDELVEPLRVATGKSVLHLPNVQDVEDQVWFDTLMKAQEVIWSNRDRRGSDHHATARH